MMHRIVTGNPFLGGLASASGANSERGHRGGHAANGFAAAQPAVEASLAS